MEPTIGIIMKNEPRSKSLRESSPRDKRWKKVLGALRKESTKQIEVVGP